MQCRRVVQNFLNCCADKACAEFLYRYIFKRINGIIMKIRKFFMLIIVMITPRNQPIQHSDYEHEMEEQK